MADSNECTCCIECTKFMKCETKVQCPIIANIFDNNITREEYNGDCEGADIFSCTDYISNN